MSRECQPTVREDCVKTDATALRRGESRLRLQKRSRGTFWDAMALRRGESRLRLQRRSRGTFRGCHGLAPWRITLATTKKKPRNFLGMPWPCAVEAHARDYKKEAAE